MGPVAAGSLPQIRTHRAVPPQESPTRTDRAGTFQIGQASGNRLRRHGYQGGRLQGRQSPLQKRVVRRAERAHLAVRSGQPRSPLDGVVAVLSVVRLVARERLELSI